MKIGAYEAWIESLSGDKIQEKNKVGFKELLRFTSRQKALLALSGGRKVSIEALRKVLFEEEGII